MEGLPTGREEMQSESVCLACWMLSPHIEPDLQHRNETGGYAMS